GEEGKGIEVFRDAIDFVAVGEGVDEFRNEVVATKRARSRDEIVEGPEDLLLREEGAEGDDIEVEDVGSRGAHEHREQLRVVLAGYWLVGYEDVGIAAIEIIDERLHEICLGRVARVAREAKVHLPVGFARPGAAADQECEHRGERDPLRYGVDPAGERATCQDSATYSDSHGSFRIS